MNAQDVKYIVVHCSATPPKMDIGRYEIDRWHRARGWRMIGYHYVIRRDGTLEEGRPLDMAGAHVYGYNDKSIGICLVGGVVKANGPAEDNFTPDQKLVLSGLLEHCLREFPRAVIVGHRDLDRKKDCPSFDVKAWWEHYNDTGEV